jgi:hypothetical protein
VVDITVILDEHAWYSVPENERKEIDVNETLFCRGLDIERNLSYWLICIRTHS